ncbi:MAG: sugar-transfer associated ATP-grasp domain-containing protein [Alphaproteobacteria bacterium]
MNVTTKILDDVRVKRSLSFQGNLKSCLESSGKKYGAQMSEMLRLMMGPGKIDPWEYYMYGLYDDGRYSPEDKRRFIGHKFARGLTKKYFPDAVSDETIDKALFYERMAAIGVPVPKTYAAYCKEKSYAAIRTLSDREEVARFVREEVSYPFFSKPIRFTNSLGVAPVRSYDKASDSLVLAGGRSVGMTQYLSEIEGMSDKGYMFQEPLKPHPGIRALSGDSVSTVRVLVILEQGTPAILHASWKIPASGNPADNFWREGNMLGAVEPESGRVVRVVDRGFPDQIEIETHPDTGARLTGATLPDWAALRDLCLEAARTFPASPLQGWDIALCEDGPVAVEVEGDGGEPFMTQLPSARGLRDERFEAHIKSSIARYKS